MSKMAHSHDWVSVKSSAGGCQLECYGSLYMALHMAFKKEHHVCVKPEAADLLEYNLESGICHFCLIYWSKEILGPVWIQAEKRLAFYGWSHRQGEKGLMVVNFSSLYHNEYYSSLPKQGYQS